MRKFTEPQMDVFQLDIADIITASKTDLIGWFGDQDDPANDIDHWYD